jgi:hypothetical protein
MKIRVKKTFRKKSDQLRGLPDGKTGFLKNRHLKHKFIRNNPVWLDGFKLKTNLVNENRTDLAERKGRAALVLRMLRGMLLCMLYMVAIMFSMDRYTDQKENIAYQKEGNQTFHYSKL